MSTKSLMTTAALLVMLMTFSACAAPIVSNEDLEATLPAAEEAAPAEETPAPAEEDVTENVEELAVTAFEDLEQGPATTGQARPDVLDIWADDTRAPVLTQVGAEYEAATGVPVAVTELPFNQIRQAFVDAAETGGGPDLIVGSFGWADELAERDLLAPIELGEEANQFLESALDAFVVDGVLVGLPYATENVALVYNPELVPEPPATWSEVSEIAAELEAEGVVEQGFVRQSGDPYHFYPILSAFGGYLFGEEDGAYNTDDLGVTTEGALAAFSWLADMVASGHLDGDAPVNYDLMHGLFESADAAMIVTGPWALPRLRASGVPFVVTALPGEAQPAAPFIGVQGFMVNALSEDVDLAQSFLTEFVADEDVMQEIFEGDPRPSAYLPVREMIEDPDLYGFALAGETGVPEPSLPAMSLIWDDLNTALLQVTRGELSPEDALDEAAAAIRADIEGQAEQ